MGRAQGADDVDPRRIALVADPGAYGFECVGAGQVAFDQVRQFQVFEHEFEKLFLRDLEDELVHAFAGIPRLARTASTAASRWTSDMFTGRELFVTGMHDGLLAAASMMKHRLVDIAAGNADLLAMLHIRDGAATDCLFDSLLDVVTVAPQKTLAVHRALVLAIEASVDHIAHKAPPGSFKF